MSNIDLEKTVMPLEGLWWVPDMRDFDPPTGKQHEIYLSDARRTDPTKLRTIIRQPFTDV